MSNCKLISLHDSREQASVAPVGVPARCTVGAQQWLLNECMPAGVMRDWNGVMRKDRCSGRRQRAATREGLSEETVLTLKPEGPVSYQREVWGGRWNFAGRGNTRFKGLSWEGVDRFKSWKEARATGAPEGLRGNSGDQSGKVGKGLSVQIPWSVQPRLPCRHSGQPVKSIKKESGDVIFSFSKIIPLLWSMGWSGVGTEAECLPVSCRTEAAA